MFTRMKRGRFAVLRKARLPARGNGLTAAHKLHYFDLSARMQNRIGPPRLLDDPAVEFDRDPRRVQAELFDEPEHSLSLGGCAGFAVEDDLYEHRSVDTLVLQPL